jgi:hypothetical protein
MCKNVTEAYRQCLHLVIHSQNYNIHCSTNRWKTRLQQTFSTQHFTIRNCKGSEQPINLIFIHKGWWWWYMTAFLDAFVLRHTQFSPCHGTKKPVSALTTQITEKSNALYIQTKVRIGPLYAWVCVCVCVYIKKCYFEYVYKWNCINQSSAHKLCKLWNIKCTPSHRQVLYSAHKLHYISHLPNK